MHRPALKFRPIAPFPKTGVCRLCATTLPHAPRARRQACSSGATRGVRSEGDESTEREQMTETAVDQRNHERVVVGRVPEGTLLLRTDTAGLSVCGVHDASASGLALLVDTPVAPGSRAVVQYRNGPIRLDVNAEVRWCEPRPAEGPRGGSGTGRYVVGVSLLGRQLLLSTLVFA